MKLGDRDVLAQEVELSDGMPPFRVTFKPDAPRLPGGENGRARTAAPKSAVSSPATTMLAFEHIEHRTLRDPSFVRRVAGRAVRVHVEKGESPSIDLKTMAWPY